MKLLNLVRLSLVLTFTVILLGAFTRLSDAGLGCPDWPGCCGHLSVPQSSEALAKAERLYPHLDVQPEKAWPEMIHRYCAGTLGLMVFAVTLLSFRHKTVPLWLPLMLSAVVIFQALLGMWTVTMKLMPVVVMGHLLGGFTLFSLLWILHWKLTDENGHYPAQSVVLKGRWWAAGALMMVIGQIILGGWTSSNYAGLMCSGLPLCEGNWVGHLDIATAFTPVHLGHDSYEFGVLGYGPRMTIHITHRIGAVLTFIMVTGLAMHCYLNNKRRQATVLMTALIIQVLIGVGNVVFGLPLVLALLHNLGAALLLIVVLYSNYRMWPAREWQAERRRMTHE